MATLDVSFFTFCKNDWLGCDWHLSVLNDVFPCYLVGVVLGVPLWVRESFVLFERVVDCRVGHFRSLLAMTKCVLVVKWTAPFITRLCHREGWKPVAIHCFTKTLPHCRNSFIACSGLPHRSLLFPPRNDKWVMVVKCNAHSITRPSYYV